MKIKFNSPFTVSKLNMSVYVRNRFAAKRVSRHTLIIAGVTGLILIICLLIFTHKTSKKVLDLPKIHPDNAKLRNEQLIITNIDFHGFITVDTDIIILRLDQYDPDPIGAVFNLYKVGNIDEALVIVSHGSLDAKGVSLLDKIRWCRILQIFYSGKESAVLHWKWTVRQVMSRLPWSSKYKGSVVLLESGEVPSPDILYVLQYMKVASQDLPAPRLLSLAGVNKDQGIIPSAQLTILPWSPRLARGVALDRSSWLQLSSSPCDVPRTVVSVQCSRVISPSQPQVACGTKYLFPNKVDLLIQIDGVHTVNKTENLKQSPQSDPRNFFWCHSKF